MTENPADKRRKRADMVTITDVARHAGVALSTVSYVLSGKRVISATTRQRVLASIRTLGYHPHAGARALASRRANVIALVLPLRSGMHLPVLMAFATAVVSHARRFDHDVLLVTADEGPPGLRRIAASAMVDGIIAMDVEMRDPRLPLLRELERPSVLIGFPADATGLTCVDLDFYRAGKACVDHLAALGHRDLALLGSPAVVYERDTGFAHRTRAGFLETAERAGLTAVAQPFEENAAAVRSRGAQRGGRLARARGAADARSFGAGRRVRGRDLPRRGGRARQPGAHLGARPGRGGGPAGGVAADAQARRRNGSGRDAARPAADRTGVVGPQPTCGARGGRQVTIEA
jgi:DNA-binding LacI/PurR family transcriptional regulator